MTGLCRGLLRNADEAEDASQQAFLSAHGAFLRGAEPRDPGAWLTTIARNECLARIRERMRRPLPVADADAAVSSSDPVLEATRRADMAALWRAVRALAPQQREAMLLREFGGLSYDELAVALGVSVPAVESLLFRARTKLRLELKTIAAALGGLLPRLLAGGSVAKVAGLTVTAGLVTGGVVATDRLPHAPPVRPHRAIVVPRIVQRPHAVVVHPTTTTQSRTKEDRAHKADVADANDRHERGDDHGRAAVVEPAEPTSAPTASSDGGSRDMSGDVTTIPATTTTTTDATTTTAATTTESGHDGGTDGSSGDGGGSTTTTTSSSDGPHS